MLVDEEQHTEALPGSTGWEPGSPVTTGREECISEMFVLSLGICVPDLPHLKTLSRLYWKLYFVIYSQNKKSFNEGCLAMENSGVTVTSKHTYFRDQPASDGGGITSQLGAVAVSLAKTRGFCVCRGSFPSTLPSSLWLTGWL